MGYPTNSLTSYDVGWNGLSSAPTGNKEIIADVLTQLTIEEKPLLAVISDDVADGLYWQWSTDRLEGRSTGGALEGQISTAQAAIQRQKLSNYVQHFQGDFNVTLDQIEMSRRGKTIGVKDELRYQAGKRTTEKLLDVNARGWSVCNSSTDLSDAPSSGSNSAGPLTGNFHYWARNTVSSTGAGGVATSAYLGHTPSVQFIRNDGAFSSANINTVGKAMYDNGVRPNTIFMGHGVKLAFDAAIFGQASSGTLVRNTDALQGTEFGTVVDFIKTSLGRYAVITDHTMPSAASSSTSANALYTGACWYMADRNQMKKAWWRHFAPYDVVTNGDAKGGYVRGSLGFKITNPYAIGGVYNVTN